MGRPEDDFDLWDSEQTRLAKREEAMQEYALENWFEVMTEVMQDGIGALDDKTQDMMLAVVIDEHPLSIKALLADLRSKFWAKAEELFEKECNR